MLLGDIAQVRAGFPFRGRLPFADDGDAQAVQMRDLTPDGALAWPEVARVRVSARVEAHWLRPGDVLFIARGACMQAVHLHDVPERVVCSPHFFVVRASTDLLLPAFLAWQINQQPARDYLARHAQGSRQRTVRRGLLEALPLARPPLAWQRRLLALVAAVREERQAAEALMNNRQAQIDALAADLHGSASLPAERP